MTADKQFIEKTFYESYLLEMPEDKQPIELLGEAYLEESQKETPDLSAIRFAQGEVYFHCKDYESANFKWENIHNELEPWAKKNRGDTYFELGLLSKAEDMYKSIITENKILLTEVSLQLFTLYIEWDQNEQASQIIKETVSYNPDYPNVTKIARAFFEKNQDETSMVELALNEALRLESRQWFEVLHQYIVNGHTDMFAPIYFERGLRKLAEIDQEKFEEVAVAMWSLYAKGKRFIPWMLVINKILIDLKQESTLSFKQLSQLYQESYDHFMNGSYLLKDIKDLIPNILTNWLNISQSTHALNASAAIFAWNERFGDSLEAATVYRAENILLGSEIEQQSNGWNEAIELSDEVLDWANRNELQVSKSLIWMLEEIKRKDPFRLLICGTYESGKSEVINSIVGSHVIGEDTNAVVIIEDDEESEMFEITESDVQKVNRIEDIPSYRQQRSFHVKMPNYFLKKHQVSLLDSPNLNGQDAFSPLLQAGDGVLFVLNAHTPLTEVVLAKLKKMKEEFSDLPIHFLLNQSESIFNEEEIAQLADETINIIREIHPKAKIFAFSARKSRNEILIELGQFISLHFTNQRLEARKTAKLLHFIKQTTTHLLYQRIARENELVDSIKWDESMVLKLNGWVNQMGDMESENIIKMTRSFRENNEQFKARILDEIPQLLKKSSDFIKEDSQFARIQDDLNDEMNRRLEAFLTGTIMPEYKQTLTSWIQNSEDEFNSVQFSLNEMADSLNELYDEEKISLQCDFKVLEDWQRDAERMTSGILHWDNVNILNRFNATQLFLKGAGKLLGALPQNSSMLYNKYRQLIESEDYRETAQLVASRFLQQFELFERSMDRDIKMFFKDPLATLNGIIDETLESIASSKEDLEKMRETPELYRDPLTLFELKQRQYEWLNQRKSKTHEYN